MPAYEYLCQACGDRFELRQKMSEPKIASCPQCGGQVKRLISGGAGIIAKANAPVCAGREMGCGGVCGCGH